MIQGININIPPTTRRTGLENTRTIKNAAMKEEAAKNVVIRVNIIIGVLTPARNKITPRRNNKKAPPMKMPMKPAKAGMI